MSVEIIPFFVRMFQCLTLRNENPVHSEGWEHFHFYLKLRMFSTEGMQEGLPLSHALKGKIFSSQTLTGEAVLNINNGAILNYTEQLIVTVIKILEFLIRASKP